MRCNMDTKSNGSREQMVQTLNFEECMIKCENPTYGSWYKFAAFPDQVNQEGPCYVKAGNGGENVEKPGTKLGIRL